MTRLFIDGRTETVRPASSEARDFVVSMGACVQLAILGACTARFDSCDTRWLTSPTLLVCAGSTSSELPLRLEPSQRSKSAELLRRACVRHVELAKDAMSGQGVDRHLFALLVAANGMGLESEFLKQSLSLPWGLSSSQEPQRQQPKWWEGIPQAQAERMVSWGGGFGPVANDGSVCLFACSGHHTCARRAAASPRPMSSRVVLLYCVFLWCRYGVSYMVCENAIYFHISSQHHAKATNSVRCLASAALTASVPTVMRVLSPSSLYVVCCCWVVGTVCVGF